MDKDKKNKLKKIIVHYRAIFRNKDMQKHHWRWMYEEIHDLFSSDDDELKNESCMNPIYKRESFLECKKWKENQFGCLKCLDYDVSKDMDEN